MKNIALVLSAALLSGCSIFRAPQPPQAITGESVVLIGEEPAALARIPLSTGSVQVRSSYRTGPGTIHYIEGKDFGLDRSANTLRRLPRSRIPDFSTNMLFGQKAFNHNDFPGFGNGGFFAFVDYTHHDKTPWPVQPDQTAFLRASNEKLKAGQPFKIVAFGDSITAGGDASSPDLIFWARWADQLQRKYPRSHVTILNGATGGDSTVQGLQRLQTKVLDHKPDLVLIGFGMNDHNISGVPTPDFERNLKEMIAKIRTQISAEIILFSAFPPNPDWKFGSHRMKDYADATARVAIDMHCAYADVFNNWQSIAKRKKPEDLLGNNINHPNDFGHWIYFRVLSDLGL